MMISIDREAYVGCCVAACVEWKWIDGAGVLDMEWVLRRKAFLVKVQGEKKKDLVRVDGRVHSLSKHEIADLSLAE